nr:sugar ABC transporter substrate-binding protein [Methylocapsa sp. S129]
MLRSESVLKMFAAAGLALAGWAAPAAAADATKVALVPGGPHPYFAAWEKAGQDAMKDFKLGAADYRVPQKWELSQQNSLLESLLSQGYNAFLVFPGDPVGSNSTVAELTENGAPVIATAGCLKEPTTALFCFGTDTGNSAYLGTKELIKAMGGKGRIVHLTGFLVDPNTQLRIDAVEKAAKETNGAVSVVQVIADIDAPEPAEEKINAYLAAHANDVDGIVTTAWVPAVVASNALRKIGDKRIKMVGIDHDEVVLKAIKDGYVNGTMLQNPYGQGYIGSYALDRIRNGCKVKAGAPFKTIALTNRFIDSGTVYADKDAVDNYVGSMQAITKKIFADFASTYLTCP